MSPGTKILIVLGCLFGLACCVCCGGGAWLVWKMNSGVSTTPADVERLTQELLGTQIPDDTFKPEMSLNVDLMVVQIRMAVYKANEAEGGLVLLQMKTADAETNRQQMEQIVRQQSANKQLEIQKSERRDITIAGNAVSFEFAEARNPDNDEQYRQVQGLLNGPDGPVLLIIQMKADDYDEAKTIELIQKLGQGEPAAD